jgi:hypothetical protein
VGPKGVESVHFRCWYCNKHYARPGERAGERFTCTCQRLLRVPRRGGGNCRVKTPVDWLVETVVYAGGGALVGFVLALLILRYIRPVSGPGFFLAAGFTLAGFLCGLLGGERGVAWVGRLGRDWHDR